MFIAKQWRSKLPTIVSRKLIKRWKVGVGWASKLQLSPLAVHILPSYNQVLVQPTFRFYPKFLEGRSGPHKSILELVKLTLSGGDYAA